MARRGAESAGMSTQVATSKSLDAVKAILRAERQKLRDLGKRNPLISYPIEQRRNSFVRVIDELPDVLWNKLKTASGGMKIVGLPVVDAADPPDEQTEAFRRSLAEAKRSDEEYLGAMRVPVPLDQIETAIPDAAIEQALRDRVRQQLGMTFIDRKRPLTLRELAAQLGVTPGYDLPRPSDREEASRRHHDNDIQTYLTEDRLEVLLKKLTSDILLRREEAGLETAYALFGFLEWYDDGLQGSARYAPLLMLPVDIVQRSQHGARRYYVNSRDGDLPNLNTSFSAALVSNVNLELPVFDPRDAEDGNGDGPERYFAEVEKWLERHRSRIPRWRLRRFVAIGSVQFGRLVMHDDLDPDAWPDAAEDGLINRLLLRSPGAAPGFAQEHEDVDEPKLELPEALLLRDADSSQHSSIIDALQGRSFAIEGPPGTGKSQTIANLIGAALAQGKTVLFLAEKMAALDVVHQRLRQDGLGDFCLQLHSTKARKRELYHAIGQRLELQWPSNSPDSARIHAELRAKRSSLNAYASTMAAKLGRTGVTVHQALWREISARDFLKKALGDAAPIRQLTLVGAELLSGTEYEVRLQAMLSLSRHLREMSDNGGLVGHPCYGLDILASPPFAADELREGINRIVSAIAEFRPLAELLLSQENQKLRTAREASSLAEQLPNTIDAVEAEIIDVLNHDGGEALTDFLSELEKFQTTEEPDPFADNEVAALIDRKFLIGLSRIAHQYLPSGGALQDLEAKLEALVQERSERVADNEALRQLAKALELDEVSKRADAIALIDAARFALEANSDSLRATALPALDGIALDTLQSIQREFASLAHQRTVVEKTIDLATAGECYDQLPESIVHLTTSWFTRLTSKRTRDAVAIGRRCYLGSKSSPNAEIAACLTEAIRYLDAERELLTATDLVQLLDRTPTSLVEAMTLLGRRKDTEEYRGSVARALSSGSTFSRAAAHKLFALSAVDQARIATVTSLAALSGLRKSFESRDDWLSRLSSWIVERDQQTDVLQRILAQSKNVGLRRDIPLRALEVVADARRNYLAQKYYLDEVSLHPSLNTFISGSQTSPQALRHVLKLYQTIKSIPLSPTARKLIQDRATFDELRLAVIALGPAINKIELSVDALTRVARMDGLKFLDGSSIDDAPCSIIESRMSRAISSREQVSSWARYCAARREAKALALDPIADFLEDLSGKIAIDESLAYKIFDYAYSNRLARLAYNDHPLLANFRSIDHERARELFQELDKKLLKSNALDLIGRLIKQGRSAPLGQTSRRVREYTELAMLRHQAGLQQSHAPIRAAFQQAKRAIQALTPCLLMSPLTVAQFLPKQQNLVDLLIIDEASQMRTEDALGSILRSKQVIVVGDPKQMPPSDLFRETSDDESDEEGLQDESILDLALASFQPARRLRWHYRSKHHSLIEFSNAKFYDGSLLVAPSAISDQHELGVCHHYIGKATYKSRLNTMEAEALVALFQRHVHERPEESAGLVAINRPQAEYLEELLDSLRSTDDRVAEFCAFWEEKLEKVFVKNLENVQGDERDAIFLSTVYGPDPVSGKVYNRFASVGGEVGWRRFNVLVTRAKKRLHLVTSLTSGDVQVSERTHRGVVALRDYLEFAKTGSLPTPTKLTGRPTDSAFEDMVLSALRDAGYSVDPQVGTAGFYVDLGVRDPDRPGRYMLGVECDGAAYHGSKSARDRDRLRQSILEANGWTIYRIWSTDWFEDSSREMQRLKSSIEAVRRFT